MTTARPGATAEVRRLSPPGPRPPESPAARGILIGAATGIVCWLLLGFAARSLWLWLAG